MIEKLPNWFGNMKEARKTANQDRLQKSREGTLSVLSGSDKVLHELFERTEEIKNVASKNVHYAEIHKNSVEERLKKEILDIYNSYVREKFAVRHDVFEKKVEKSFWHGFKMYLRSAYRIDRSKAHLDSTRSTGLEHSQVADAQRDFITYGDNAGYLKNVGEYSVPQEPKEGYDDKYFSSSSLRKSWTSARENYIYEKMSLFSHDFTRMLLKSLQEGLDVKDVLRHAERVYGVAPDIFEEMKQYDIEPELVSQLAQKNPHNFRQIVEPYIMRGRELEQQYPVGSRAWIHGPRTIRSLALQYPNTFEQGIQLLDREFDLIREKFPQVPVVTIIEIAMQDTQGFHNDFLETRVKQVSELMDGYPCPAPWGAAEEPSVFAYLGLESMVYELVSREKNIDTASRHVTQAVDVLYKVDTSFREKGKIISDAELIKIAKDLLAPSGSILPSPNSIIGQIQMREIQMARSVDVNRLSKLEKQHPYWAEHIYAIGYGESEEEKNESGRRLVEWVRQECQDDLVAQRRLERSHGVLEEYRNKTLVFKQPPVSYRITEAVIHAPYSVQEWYNTQYNNSWPVDVEEINFGETETYY